MNVTMDNYFPDGQFSPDYLGVDGQAIFGDVVKALSATGTLPRSGPGIDALGIEDLSGTLKSAEIRERQLHFWRDMPKDPAYSLVVEWSRVDDLGEYGATGFVTGAASETGVITDPQFLRGTKEIKYMAVKGQVTLATQLVKLVGFRGPGVNAMDTSEELKMLELLRHVERNLFFGNSAVSSDQWDGAIKQIDDAATNANGLRIDLEGNPPDKELLERISQIAANNSCDLSHIYLPNQAMRDLRASLFPYVRIDEAGPAAGSIGSKFEQFLIEEIGGDPAYMKLRRTQMLTRGVKGGLPLDLPTVASPNAPTFAQVNGSVEVLGAARTDATSTAHPGLAAGTYYYSVSAVGKGGRTIPLTMTNGSGVEAGVTVAANGQCRLTIKSTDSNILYFEIFRNPRGNEGSSTSKRKFLARVNRSSASVTWDDTGYYRPGTYDIVALMMAYDEIQFRQLLPVMKRVLPQDLMANAYALLMFGTPVFQVPTHNIHIANCGERAQPGVIAAT